MEDANLDSRSRGVKMRFIATPAVIASARTAYAQIAQLDAAAGDTNDLSRRSLVADSGGAFLKTRRGSNS
jgi:hypothetical protein